MSPTDMEQMTQLAKLRNSEEVKNWKMGDPYPDLQLPDGYGFSYNMMSGRLVIIEESSIGVPSCDPRYERYWTM